MGKNRRDRHAPQHPSAAKTTDDNNPDNWPLLSAEWRLTFERCRSRELADRLVQRYLEGGERDHEGRRRYRIWEIDSMPGVPSPRSGEFWRSYPDHDIHCVIDCENSSARWTGPASELQQQMFGRRIVECNVRMIQLNHRLYLEFLQSAGLPAPGPARAESVAPTAPPATSVPANSTIRVELADKIKVQLVEKPKPPVRAQSPSQLTEDQIQALTGDDVSELRDTTEKRLRRYMVLKYGARWRDILPANAMKGAEHDPLYEKEVGVAGWTISTWRRALGRKDRNK